MAGERFTQPPTARTDNEIYLRSVTIFIRLTVLDILVFKTRVPFMIFWLVFVHMFLFYKISVQIVSPYALYLPDSSPNSSLYRNEMTKIFL